MGSNTRIIHNRGDAAMIQLQEEVTSFQPVRRYSSRIRNQLLKLNASKQTGNNKMDNMIEPVTPLSNNIAQSNTKVATGNIGIDSPATEPNKRKRTNNATKNRNKSRKGTNKKDSPEIKPEQILSSSPSSISYSSPNIVSPDSVQSSHQQYSYDPKEHYISSSDLQTISPDNQWIDLNIPPEELRPSATLTTGQCFNWLVVVRDDIDIIISSNTENIQKEEITKGSAWGTHDETEWVGPLFHDHVISIRELPNTTMYRVLHEPTTSSSSTTTNAEDTTTKSNNDNDVSKLLLDYFQIQTSTQENDDDDDDDENSQTETPSLTTLYQEWSQSDQRLAKIARVLVGVRIVRQEPLECLLSFICSSNNNIPRITKMVCALRETYGHRLLDLPFRSRSSTTTTIDNFSTTIYSFPTLTELGEATEQNLRDLGLGYRAKYIIQTRDLLQDCGGEDYLYSLRTKYKNEKKDKEETEQQQQEEEAELVQKELLQFTGVGRKVADCVALFSLDQTSAIPVDVHVQHIASRDYDPSVLGSAKSLTPSIYKKVGDLFRDRFGTYAGWAHSLLFVAELPSFRSVLPRDVLEEMDEWKEIETKKKAEAKAEKMKGKSKELIIKKQIKKERI